MTKKKEPNLFKNKPQLKKFTLCINFINFAKEDMPKIPDQKKREAQLGFITMIEDMLNVHSEKYFKGKEGLNEKEEKDFMQVYNFCEKFYKATYKGNPFHIQFDYPPKTKDE